MSVVNSNKRLSIFFELILLKILYILTIILLLPETNMLWSFNKSICLPNIVFEIIPFVIGEYFVINGYYRNNAYSFFNTLFFILFFIPINSGLVLSNDDWFYYILINSFSILFMYLVSRLSKRENIIEDGLESNEENVYFILFDRPRFVWIVRAVFIVVCIATIIYVYKYNGLNFSILYADMYSVRADYAEYAQEIQGSLASYLSLIITKVSGWILPLYLYYSIMKNKPFDIVICLFTFIANYTVEMQKTSLFIIVVVLFVVILEKRNYLHKATEIFIMVPLSRPLLKK